MKIAYVGNYRLDFTTETHIAKTLEKLGHEVVRIQELQNKDPEWILQVTNDVDMLLYTRTWGQMVTLEDLEILKKRGIPTASYHLDLYVGLARQSGIESDPFWRTEYVFSADGDPESQLFFENKGINHHWLLPAVFEDECYMATPNEDTTLSGDVIFVGGGAEYGHSEWSYRHELAKHLGEKYGSKYRKYGHPQRTVRGKDLNQLYANAKIAIGDSVNIGFKHKNYTSDRLYESMGRGAFTIYPRIEGVTDQFPEALQDTFYDYGDFDGLDKKIDYYLTHEKERETLRAIGFEFVKGSQTYTQRLQQLLDTMSALGAFDKRKAVTEDVLDESKVRGEAAQDNIKINLGSGEDPMEGYVNLDMMDLPEVDVVHNLLVFPYPFEDNSATHIRAVDVIEHLPPYIGMEHGVIKFLEECHRILRVGGELYLQTPGWNAEFLWDDPTHVRGFSKNSMDFFDPDKHFGQTTGFYSKCKFEVRAEELENHNLRFWMKKR